MTDRTLADEVEGAPEAPPPPPGRGPAGFDWAALLRRETGPGALDAYADHPLNPAPGNPHGGRIARGLEGLTGGARWALVDLALGALGLLRGRGRPHG